MREINSNIVDMFAYENDSYRRQLKKLYEVLDQTQLSYEIGFEKRHQFMKEMRGQFVQVSKLKRQTPLEQILDLLKMSEESLKEVENGNVDMRERDYFLLIAYLGCSQEFFVFSEKLEQAMIPGLRKARQALKSILKVYGFVFADREDK